MTNVAVRCVVLLIVMTLIGTMSISEVKSISGTAYEITFYYYPPDACCGRINFNGTYYYNYPLGIPHSGYYKAGNYTATLVELAISCPPNCAEFLNWTSRGGVSVGSSYSHITDVTITGNGTLTANFYVPPSMQISPLTNLLALSTASISLAIVIRIRIRRNLRDRRLFE